MFITGTVLTFVTFVTGTFCTPISSPLPNDPFSSHKSTQIKHLRSYPELDISSLHRNFKFILFGKDPKRNGYTLDPCRSGKDCKGSRKCLNEHLEKACNGENNCICFPRNEETCYAKCTECSEYPNETCGYLLEDLRLGSESRPTAMCISTSSVFLGRAVEVGCQSFILKRKKPGLHDLFKRRPKKLVLF